MVFLFLCLLTAGLLINFVQKYILRIKEPNIDELWRELESEEWFIEFIKNPKIKDYVEQSKDSGLLSDPYYVRKILDHEGHREGFLNHVVAKLK
ncbi:hypothetical protein ACFYKX_01740 [Cytobacillus sp. FJAT-54145]|uniref:Uncharacterized protein n=1 Tax=Cytobacillus spartinae TaxID=3299023 RepID=A0ABW6K6Z0_9BACI